MDNRIPQRQESKSENTSPHKPMPHPQRRSPPRQFSIPDPLLHIYQRGTENHTKRSQCSSYADDLAIWTTEENIGTAKVRLQITLDNLKMWTHDWIMKVNAEKTTYTTFTLSTKKTSVILTLNGQKLREENNPKYLGITFDPRMTWKPNIESCQQKGVIRTRLLRRLAGIEWGADSNILRKTYTGYVRPVLEYGITAWGTAARSNLQKVISVQNQNLRIITGGMKSTPIHIMECQSQMESLHDRRDKKPLTQRA